MSWRGAGLTSQEGKAPSIGLVVSSCQEQTRSRQGPNLPKGQLFSATHWPKAWVTLGLAAHLEGTWWLLVDKTK